MAEEEVVAIPAPPLDLKRKLDEIEPELVQQPGGSDDGANGVIVDDSKAASDSSQAKRPKLDDDAADGLGISDSLACCYKFGIWVNGFFDFYDFSTNCVGFYLPNFGGNS